MLVSKNSKTVIAMLVWLLLCVQLMDCCNLYNDYCDNMDTSGAAIGDRGDRGDVGDRGDRGGGSHGVIGDTVGRYRRSANTSLLRPAEANMTRQVSCDWWRAGHVTS